MTRGRGARASLRLPATRRRPPTSQGMTRGTDPAVHPARPRLRRADRRHRARRRADLPGVRGHQPVHWRHRDARRLRLLGAERRQDRHAAHRGRAAAGLLFVARRAARSPSSPSTGRCATPRRWPSSSPRSACCSSRRRRCCSRSASPRSRSRASCPTSVVHILGAVVPVDRFILTGLVIVAAAALAAVVQVDQVRPRHPGGVGERVRRDAQRAVAESSSRWPTRCSPPCWRARSASSPPRSPSSTRRRCRCRSSRRWPPR